MAVETQKELPPIELNEAFTFLNMVVPVAGEKLRTYFNSGDSPQIEKGVFDFLTQADEDVDKFLIDEIRKKFPQSNFLTEESAPEDYSQLNQVSNLWIIDPLDGTINFSRNNPQFSISIALVNKGQVDLGYVYLPMTNDVINARSDFGTAYLNGEPIHVSSIDNLKKAVFISDLPWEPEKRSRSIGMLNRLSQQVRFVKMTGSGVWEAVNIAKGDIDGAVLTGSKPWDVAAAGLIIEKAGGIVTEIDGSDWTPFSPTTLLSNGRLHNSILEIVK